jgi:predicted nucleotidyltransferase
MGKQFNTIKNLLTSHQEQLSQLGGYHMAIFGSIARDEATDDSDVDILVDFDSKKGLFGFADLKFYLEEILGCHVDLVTRRALHPALKSRILSESKKIF